MVLRTSPQRLIIGSNTTQLVLALMVLDKNEKPADIDVFPSAITAGCPGAPMPDARPTIARIRFTPLDSASPGRRY